MTDAHDKWRAAERLLMHGDIGDADLDASLAPFLRALAVVNDGRPEAITQLAGSLGDDNPLLAALLQALSGTPTPIADTGALPDLLQAAMADLQRMPIPVSDAVDAVQGERPALRAAWAAINDAFVALTRDRALTESLPRAEQLRIAATGLQLHGTINQATIAHAFEDPLIDMATEHWPDLRTDPTLLLRWLRQAAPWNTAHDMALKAAIRAEPEVREGLLRAFLERIHQNLDQGKVRPNLGVVYAAEQIAQSLETRRALAIFLSMLEQRLLWIENEAPPAGLLIALWKDASLATDERLRVARDLLDSAQSLPQQIAISAQFFLLAQLEDPDEAASLLADGAAAAPSAMLQQGLQQMGASDTRRVHMMTLHATLNGDLGPALSGLQDLIEGHDASDIAQSVMVYLFQSLVPGTQLPAALTDALSELLTALNPSHWKLKTLVPLMLVARSHLPVVPAVFVSNVEAAFAAPEQDPIQTAGRILVALLRANPDATTESVRDVGRMLRKMAPEAGQDLALLTAAWAAIWAGEPMRAQLEQALVPIDKYLLRLDSPALAAVAQRAANEGAAQLRGTMMWYFWHREVLDDDPLWMDLCFRSVQVPESVEHLGARIVRGALAQNPPSFHAFRALVGQEIERVLSNMPRKKAAPEPETKIRVLPLLPPSIDGCRQLFVDQRGALVPDPYQLLGLSPQADLDDEVVRLAWAHRLTDFPPETDPDGARRLREARDRLLSTAQLYERKFGQLWVPEVDGLELPQPPEIPAAKARLRARDRIIGQLVIYAMVEDMLDNAARQSISN